MDLEKYRELLDLNEKIYHMKMKNAQFEVQKEVFEQICSIDDELNKLDFVHDFIVLINQNLKKMSALTLTLMNQSQEQENSNNVFKIRKEMRSVLIEYLQRIINFTLKDDNEIAQTDLQEMNKKFDSDDIAPIYEFIVKKLDTNVIRDDGEKKILNEMASDFQKILDQLEKFNKVWSKQTE